MSVHSSYIKLCFFGCAVLFNSLAMVYAQDENGLDNYRCEDDEFCRLPIDCEAEGLNQAQCEEVTALHAASRDRGKVIDDANVRDQGGIGAAYSENTEQLLPSEVFTLWLKYGKEDVESLDNDTQVVYQTSFRDQVSTIKLTNLVDNIQFVSGESNIPEAFVQQLRDALNRVGARDNVRLHFIGHTDNEPLSESGIALYGDNVGLSRSRAEQTALYFQEQLRLPSSSISYEGRGDSEPIASNATPAGRALNRRVSVEVWYDEISQEEFQEALIIQDDVTRLVQVCRVQTRCILKRRAGVVKKAQLRHLVKPLPIDENNLVVPERYLRDIRQLLIENQNRQGLKLRFIGHTDNAPLTDTQKKIYGNHVDFTKSIAQRVSQLVADQLNLAANIVEFDGRGGVRPIASNLTAQGRALNKRVDLELWYDIVDDEEALQAQVCPADGDADVVNVIYDAEKPVIQFRQGQPVYPQGLEQRINRILKTLEGKSNLRMVFVGHTSNASLTRRQAGIYPNHKALSARRAKIVLDYIRTFTDLDARRYLFEGRGFVEPVGTGKSIFDSRVFNVAGRSLQTEAGAADPRDDRVEIEFHYDELAVLEQDEDIEIIEVLRHESAVSPYALLPVRISVDGNSIDGTRVHQADIQRCTDVALDDALVQLNYDATEAQAKLHVDAIDNTVWLEDNIDTQAKENLIQFVMYSNYDVFIENAEVRVFNTNQSLRSEPVAILPIDPDTGIADWIVPENVTRFTGPKKAFVYVLRAYGSNNKFDETQPKEFWLTRDPYQASERSATQTYLDIYGYSSLRKQDIAIKGGTVSVYGQATPEEHQVWVIDKNVPISADRTFVTEQILPFGQHAIEVAMVDNEGTGNIYVRNLQLEDKKWFAVGIADVTMSQDQTNGPASLVTNDETRFNNELFVEGRLAFYTKGNISDEVELTASMDTGVVAGENLLDYLYDKNPDYLFRRLDQDYHYSTFGDDSTTVDGAPTQGKLYAKLQRRKSYALWGSFETDLITTDLAQVDRGLYGLQIHGETDARTQYNEAKHQVDLFVADPGTLSTRDEFRGTGGSLYFLNHRDITQGSERLRLEIRDKDSGIVLATEDLVPVQDYDIDYIQGRIILNESLGASADDNLLVQTGGLSGHAVYLVARYEYTPGLIDVDDAVQGLRYATWLNDQFQFGITQSRQDIASSNQAVTLDGLDLTYRKSLSTYLKLEAATTEGSNDSTYVSNDGGFTFTRTTDPSLVTMPADSYRIEVAAKVNELAALERDWGSFTFYQQQRDAGFSAPGQATNVAIHQLGFSTKTPINTRWRVNTQYDVNEQATQLETEALDVNADYTFNERWQFTMGGRYDVRDDLSTTPPTTQTQGKRTDLAFQANYDPRANWSAYGFTQLTASTSGNRDDNDRIGAGGQYVLNAKTTLNGELSFGDAGTAGVAGVDYLLNESSRLYFNHRVEQERDISGLLAQRGNSTLGFNTRYSDSLSVYGEERYAFGEQPNGLTHAYGIDYATNSNWLLGGSVEVGQLEDYLTAAKTARQAFGFSAQRSANSVEYRGVVELRNDKTETNTSDFFLLKNDIQYQFAPSWRILGKYYYSDNENSLGEFYEGDFSEFSLGYAYRPIAHDRLNILLNYTYLENRPTLGQIEVDTTTGNNVLQKSQVVALDVNYDVSPRITLGGKYATRLGEVALDRENPVYISNNAELVIARADWHVVRHWDVLIEARQLAVEQAADVRRGMLFGVYRHLGQYIKLGAGYNYTDFSDDLTDLDYDSQGLFINIVGKL